MSNTKPNEDTRVKLPALFHTTRLGYSYVSLKNYLKDDKKIDAETNIFIDIFKESISKINKSEYSKTSAELVVEFLSQSLGTEKQFTNFLIPLAMRILVENFIITL